MAFKFLKNVGYASNGLIVYLNEDNAGAKWLGMFSTESTSRNVRYIQKSILMASTVTVTEPEATPTLKKYAGVKILGGMVTLDFFLDKTLDINTLLEAPDGRAMEWEAYRGIENYFSNVPRNLPETHGTETLGSINPTTYPFNSTTDTGDGKTTITVVPAVSKSSVTNVSGQTTVSLSGLVTNAAPSGAILVWHTSSVPSILNRVADPGSVEAGTYYPFFYDATSGAYSPAGTGVTVTIAAASFFSSPLTWIQENPLLFAGILLVALLLINYVVLPALGMQQWFGGGSQDMKRKGKSLKRLRS